MERKDVLIKLIIAMRDELNKKKEDLNFRLEKYILENKIIVDSHIRFYYQEVNGRIFSMLVLHELTNKIVVLDAPKNGDINPRLHLESSRNQLKEILKADGWIVDDDINKEYCSLKKRII